MMQKKCGWMDYFRPRRDMLVSVQNNCAGCGAVNTAPPAFTGQYAYLGFIRIQQKPAESLRCNSRANQSVRRSLAGFLPQHWFTHKTTGCCSTDTDRGTDEREKWRNSRQRVGGRSHNRGDALVQRVYILSHFEAFKIRCNWLIRKVKQPLSLTRRDAAAISETSIMTARNDRNRLLGSIRGRKPLTFLAVMIFALK